MHWRDGLAVYAEQHEEHCTEFARAIFGRAEKEGLFDQSDPSKQGFIEYLETGLVDRDLRELF